MNFEQGEFIVHFCEGIYQPVKLAAGSILSEHLSVENSPLLFGCRTGICGTCLVEIEAQHRGELREADEDERDLLDIIAPGNAKARLACQISLIADITVRYIGK